MRTTVPPVAVAAAAIVGVILVAWQQQPKATTPPRATAPTTAPQSTHVAARQEPRAGQRQQPPPPPGLVGPSRGIPSHRVPGGVCPGRARLRPLARILDLPCEIEIHPYCAHEYDSVLVSASDLPNRLVHDCQKLVLDTATYGPLAAVLPAPLNWSLRHLVPPTSAENVSYNLVDIIIYDSTEYPSLNLKPELNCLRITGQLPNPRTWTAEIGKAESCATLGPLDHPASMEVKVLPYRDLTGLPDLASALAALDTLRHPSTARWGWDGATQYIGAHCGIAWCEFGPKGFKGSGSKYGDGIGLRDEQLLAEVDSSISPPRLRPSKVWGLIQPDTGLGHYDDNALAQRRHVASIVLTDRLGAPPPRALLTEVLRRAAPPPGFQPPGAGTGPGRTKAYRDYVGRYKLHELAPDTGVSFTDIYMKRVGTTYGIGTRLNVTQWTQTVRCPWKHAAVGSARWRWDSKDEDMWVACSQGCCTATQIQQ